MPRVNNINELPSYTHTETVKMSAEQVAALPPEQVVLFNKLREEGGVKDREDGDYDVTVTRRARMLDPKFVEESWDDPEHLYYVETDPERIEELTKVLIDRKQALEKKYGIILPSRIERTWSNVRRTKLVLLAVSEEKTAAIKAAAEVPVKIVKNTPE